MCIQIRSYDMVLGVQWLETLGEIVCDFKIKQMNFAHNREKLILKGIIFPRRMTILGLFSHKMDI